MRTGKPALMIPVRMDLSWVPGTGSDGTRRTIRHAVGYQLNINYENAKLEQGVRDHRPHHRTDITPAACGAPR
jgi:hypothetical protein